MTPDIEQTIAYIARVSNPNNQDNPDYYKLIKYCITHKHFSIFEHGYMTFEITCPIAIATQIIRHRSFTFQQFSQRYQSIDQIRTSDEPRTSGEVAERYYMPELREQDTKNRQNSTDSLPSELKDELEQKIYNLQYHTNELYNYMLDKGVAKECARFILPQSTMTRLYMTGNVRSWIHYIDLRTDPSTQLEHRVIAEKCKNVFVKNLPVISNALEWYDKTDTMARHGIR